MSKPQLPDDSFRAAYREGRYTSLGSYPKFAWGEGRVLCWSCLRENLKSEVRKMRGNDRDCLKGIEINWESTDLYCDECGEPIESAYGAPADESGLSTDEFTAGGESGLTLEERHELAELMAIDGWSESERARVDELKAKLNLKGFFG